MKTLNKKTFFITRTAVLLALALAIQFTLLRLFPGNPVATYIVGSLLNMIFFVAGMTVGIWGGIFIGIMTPVVAFLTGHLPFAVLIPFVVAANIVIVTVFVLLRNIKKNNFIVLIIAGAVASISKFLLMFLTGKFILPLITVLKPPVVAKLAASWGVTQLVTAIIGLALAVAVVKALKRTNILEIPEAVIKEENN